MVLSSLFQALLSVVKTYADTDSQLPSITFWLMGSLGKDYTLDVLETPGTVITVEAAI